jgi:hypothetical protein
MTMRCHNIPGLGVGCTRGPKPPSEKDLAQVRAMLEDMRNCVGFDAGGRPVRPGPICCEWAGGYNGFASGPPLFICPKHCACHD